MWKTKITLLIGTVLLAVSAVSLQAQPGGAEFSAQIVQKGPEGKVSSGKMYVGEKRIRTDMDQKGQQIIHVVDNVRHTEWLLYPDQRTYMEIRSESAPPGVQEKPSSEDPCAQMRGVTCERLGEEQVADRRAVKWKMTFDYKGESFTGFQWIDEERGIPLRQQMPDGQTTELRLLGPDRIDGRSVEKWERIVSRGSEAPQRSYQWYDPKLELAIREEFPGGYVRELRDIREGKQPDILFSIPAGYRQISQPTTDIPPAH